jgi:hypothetical protein
MEVLGTMEKTVKDPCRECGNTFCNNAYARMIARERGDCVSAKELVCRGFYPVNDGIKPL